MNKYKDLWKEDKVREAAKDSINLTETLEKLGIPRQGKNSTTLRKFMDDHNIDYSHFTGRAREYKNSNKTSAIDYLGTDKKIKTSSLKQKLIEEGYKENKCEICGCIDWQGKPLTMQLHHLDGNPKNNSLSNLQILCPNCHSQTDNFCGNANKNPKPKRICPICGKREIKTPGAKTCSACAHKLVSRKVIRPSKEDLINEFKSEKSFTGIAKLHGVSDKSIVKWFGNYGLPTKLGDLKQMFLNKPD